MADPVTLAMVGAAAGAALKPNDPLKGAMLGATAGFTGGTALGVGAAGAGAASGAAAGTAGAAGSTAANTALASQIAANPAASFAGGNILNTANAANAANTANLASMNAAGMSFAGASPSAVNAANTANMANSANAANSGLSFAGMSPNAASTAPSFMDKLGMAGKSAYENPMMTVQALNATQGLLTPDQQMASAPTVPVQARGQLRPFDPVALLDPYKPSVIGGQQNQPISLIQVIYGIRRFNTVRNPT